MKWTESDESVLIDFVKGNPIIYDSSIRDPGNKRDHVKGLFELFTKNFFHNRMPANEVRARWQKLRSYYIVLMKNKLNSVDTRGNFKEDGGICKWKHMQAMGFLEPYVKLLNNDSKQDHELLNCQNDSDSQQLQTNDEDEEPLRASSSLNIKQEAGMSDSIVQDSFEPMRYCAVGLQNSLVDNDLENEQNDAEIEEDGLTDEINEVKMDNLSMMYQEHQRRRGRPRKRGLVPVVTTMQATTSTPIEKRPRGRPKGYSPLKKAKYMQQQEIQQHLLQQQQVQQIQQHQAQATSDYANGEDAFYNNQIHPSFLRVMDESDEMDDTNLIPPPQLHKIPNDLNNQSHQTSTSHQQLSVSRQHNHTNSTTAITNGQQPATSTTTELTKDQQESDHMAKILMSMLHRIENPVQRTEVFIQMLTLCKNYMQVN